jgi:hypothetical protein
LFLHPTKPEGKNKCGQKNISVAIYLRQEPLCLKQTIIDVLVIIIPQMKEVRKERKRHVVRRTLMLRFAGDRNPLCLKRASTFFVSSSHKRKEKGM